MSDNDNGQCVYCTTIKNKNIKPKNSFESICSNGNFSDSCMHLMIKEEEEVWSYITFKLNIERINRETLLTTAH